MPSADTTTKATTEYPELCTHCNLLDTPGPQRPRPSAIANLLGETLRSTRRAHEPR